MKTMSDQEREAKFDNRREGKPMPKASPETEVFVNENLTITIRDLSVYEGEPSSDLVTIKAADIPAVIEMLKSMALLHAEILREEGVTS